MTIPNTISFGSTELKILNHNNQPCLTASQLSLALGYKDSRSLTKVFNRNESEFTPDMTEVVNLTPSSNLLACSRIFSPRGCHLIAMFSRTDKAKEFRRWVLDVLDNLVEKEAPLVIGEVKPVEYPYLLKFEELHDCGWSMEINKLLHALKANEGKEIIIKPGAIARSMSEVRTLMHLTESYRAKLDRIQAISKY
ncbi:BRO-N domain-containing protein [Marinicellulosiphila megalodicopiae]|uniref:BRO-N domain-containing protein n=1 Tax=Marinicellulosiphila megalodicopiae TaxID=2724896 RepID=UPI003BAF5155